jgi:endonuclease III
LGVGIAGKGGDVVLLLHFDPRRACFRRIRTSLTKHGILGEDLAVKLRDQIILAVAVIAPDLAELDSFHRHAGTEYQQRPHLASGSDRITFMPKVVPAKKKVLSSGTSSTTRKKSSFDPLDSRRVSSILEILGATYPTAECALHHRNAWELLVATILSAQCTDVRVNMVTPDLFARYPTPQSLAAARPEEIEPMIKSTGFFRNKAKSIVGAARRITEAFGGQVPDSMETLLTVPGAARKTANVVLGSWYRKAEGVVVDTHVFRISRRLELTRWEDAGKVEQDLMRVIPRDRWISFSHQVIWHGRALCIARKPRCVDCPLEALCHASDKTWSTVEIHRFAKP